MEKENDGTIGKNSEEQKKRGREREEKRNL